MGALPCSSPKCNIVPLVKEKTLVGGSRTRRPHLTKIVILTLVIMKLQRLKITSLANLLLSNVKLDI